MLGIAITFRQRHHQAKRAATRDDGGLMHRITFRFIHRDQSMARFMIGGHPLFSFRHYKAAPFGTHHYLVFCGFKFRHTNRVPASTRRQQGCFIHKIGQISARETRCAACNHLRVHIGSQRHLAHMHTQDFLAPIHIRIGHHNLPVETAGAQQRRIKHIRAVRCGNQDHTLIAFKPVHFNKHLIERLFTFIIAAAKPGAAMAPDRVNFVNEDDARRVLLALFEHVTHARCANTHEHFDKIRTGNGEKRHIGFAGDGTSQQGFTSPRRPHQQHALRDLAAQALEFLRIAQEFHNFFKLRLGFINAGNIIKGHTALLFGQQLGPRFAEAHGAPATALHLAHEENPDPNQQQHREPGRQIMQQRIDLGLLGAGHHAHALFGQARNHGRVFRRVGGELAAIAKLAGQGAALDGDIAHMACLHLIQKVGIGDLRGARAA